MEFDEDQLAVLLLYAGRAISRAQAAKRLKTSERQVTRYMRDVKLSRVVSDSRVNRTEAEKRRLARQQAAAAVSAGHITPEQAAARAGCSVRTIYRYLK